MTSETFLEDCTTKRMRLVSLTGRYLTGLIHGAHFGVQLNPAMDRQGIVIALVIIRQPAPGANGPNGSRAFLWWSC